MSPIGAECELGRSQEARAVVPSTCFFPPNRGGQSVSVLIRVGCRGMENGAEFHPIGVLNAPLEAVRAHIMLHNSASGPEIGLPCQISAGF